MIGKDYLTSAVTYDEENKTINIKRESDGAMYGVSIKSLETEGQGFDWICYFSTKSWVTPEILYDFIHKIRDKTNINDYCQISKKKKVEKTLHR